MRDLEKKTRDEAAEHHVGDPFPAGAVVGYAVAALFNAVLTVAKESIPALKDAMASAAGHHWPAHAIANALVFAAVWVIFRRRGTIRRAPELIVCSTVLSAAIILVFYMIHWWVL